ncbi:MAG: hypothetical protein MZV70_60530 [Desulfobacterales bacterium]|nr:hypothetical protein [Desulfobacterales bacterium]
MITRTALPAGGALEYQRLGDLPHLAADGPGGVLGAAGGLLHFLHPPAQPQTVQGFLDPAGTRARFRSSFPLLRRRRNHRRHTALSA